MSCKRPGYFIPFAALALLVSCHRQVARPAVESIAILRFENLGADPSSDWMGRAFSEIIAFEVEGAPGYYDVSAGRMHAIQTGFGARPAAAPGVSAERTGAIALGATWIGYGQYFVRNGILQAQLSLEDTLTGNVRSIGPVSMPAADIVAAASAIASQISPHAIPYDTRNSQVVKAHVDALEAGETPAFAEDLTKAIAADPNYGPSYQHLAQFKVQQNDLAGALGVLNGALARGNAIADADRARLQLQIAVLRNDTAGRMQALTALAKADSNDPQTWRDLAGLATATHRYQEAADAFRKSVAIQPGDVDAWNQFGYAAAYGGDLNTAVEALNQYQKLVPASPNPLDSMGDVNLIGGRMPEAESSYERSAKMNPAFFGGLDFVKEAMAHLMTGDVPGADTVAGRYFDSRITAKDPLVDYRRAQWLWISGRRKAACLQMEKLADAAGGASKEIASRGYSELAIWNLMLGNREQAAKFADKAIALVTPSSANQALMARFLAQPPASAAEWEARAAKLAPNPAQSAIRDVALADALLFAKEYAAVTPVLQRMYDSGNPGADEGLPVLLAWAYVETGKVEEAAHLLRSNYPLSDTGITWSTSLHFPRIFYLRGVVAQKQGKADEAQKNFHLFEQLSGTDPLLWGEEQSAR